MMEQLFVDRLANPEHEPKRFEFQVKMAKFELSLSKGDENE